MAASRVDAVDSQPEIKITKLLISGADIQVEDRTANPPLIVPLTGLEFKAHDLSSKALTNRARSATTSC